MSDWAEKAAKRAADSERRGAYEAELKVREARIKDEAGPQAIQQLHSWLRLQIAQYNKLRGKVELQVKHILDSNRNAMYQHEITVSRIDRKKSPLVIGYSETDHILHWECGAGRGQFSLRVDDDGQVYFENPDHDRKTVEELGRELLEKHEEAVL